MRFDSTAWRRSLFAVLLAAGVGAPSSVASAAERVALVMGNSAYAEIPLCEAIARTLQCVRAGGLVCRASLMTVATRSSS